MHSRFPSRTLLWPTILPIAVCADSTDVFTTRAFWFTVAAFGIFGFVTGVWEVLLADLRTALGVSVAGFGVALTIGFLGAPPAMLLGGRLSDRFGPRALIGATGLLMSLALFGLSRVNDYWLLAVVFVCYFVANSAYDVTINAAGIDVEQTHGKQLLSYFHAAFSGSAAIGALCAGVVLWFDIEFRVVYTGLAALLSVVVVGLVVSGRSVPLRRSHTKTVLEGSNRKSLFRNGSVVLVAVVVCLAYFAEGAIENWSAIYLRTWLTFPAVIGAAGVAMFHSAMFVGRLSGSRVIAAVGRRRTLTMAGGFGAVGMTVALATTIPSIILAGIFVVGLSMSVVAPVGFSLAGALAPGRSGEASTVVTFVGWSAFIAGPAIIGGVAGFVGLRLALGTVVVTAGLIFLLSFRIPLSPSRRE